MKRLCLRRSGRVLDLSLKVNEMAEDTLLDIRSGGWIHLGVWVKSISQRMGFFLRSAEMEAINLGEPDESVTGTLWTITLVQGMSLEASAEVCLGARADLMMDLTTVSSWGKMSLVKDDIVTIGFEYSCQGFHPFRVSSFLSDFEVEEFDCVFA